MTNPFPAQVIVAAQAAHKTFYPLGPFASVTLAQWAVESDYGRAMPAGSNNPFGIKSFGDQPYVEAMTREVIGGVSEEIPQRFAKYASLTDAFVAHARLLATSSFYRAAQEAATPDAYVRAMAPRYATAPNYAEVLLSVMKEYNLYKYDLPVQGAKMSNIPAAVAAMPTPAPLAPVAPPPATNPSAPSPVVVDYGDMAAQILADAEPILAAAAQGAAGLALSAIPMGSFFSNFIGPTVISGYVSQAITAVAGGLKGQALTIANPNDIEKFAANLFAAGEPALASFLGDSVAPTISALVAKALPAPAAGKAPTVGR